MHRGLQVFGQIKGELGASDFLIGDGGQIEGSFIAQDVTVYGRVKGHDPCRPRQVAGGWYGRGRCFPSVVVDRRELYLRDRHGELKIQLTRRRSAMAAAPARFLCPQV